MKWRIIELEQRNAFMHMALDEAVSEAVAGGANPTIRFYTWNPGAVSIGCFQSLHDEVDVEACTNRGIDVVRRRTGGGAVYHDMNGEITYSVIASEALLPKGITESYLAICGWVIAGLSHLGLSARFKPINDILVGDRKISGNAQTRRNGVVLQHGTILYDLDVHTMFSLLKVSKEKISDKMITDVRQRVTRVLDHTNVSPQEVYEALLVGFTADKEHEFGAYTSEELRRAEELAATRYATKEWNEMR
ncbi:MAG: lipoate--protein ligase family protein [Candidatus Aenigmarchaeota archaeon]|nr:lipoate--protein ligase family protein [Candidatus Aenigmarchaeota archaeon]